MVGGTALALKLGHRKSIDIDLFNDKKFDSDALSKHLQKTYNAEIRGAIKNGVFGFINDIKIDLIAHQYPLLKLENIDNIRMASLEDIGAMKLNAILYSGSRLKDFVDIHRLLEHFPLQTFTDSFLKKYPDANAQMVHTALLYHKDVDPKQPIDFIGPKISWAEIVERLHDAVNNPGKLFNKTQLNEDQEPFLQKKRHRIRKGRRL